MKFFILTILICIYSTVLFSQHRCIKGVILDAVTNKAVPNAHIFFDPKHASVSNVKGAFILNYDEQNNNDSIIISCIGYQTKIISIEEFTGSKSFNEISLNPITYKLDEVIIPADGLSPYELLQCALNNLKTNYLDRKICYHCSYYEHIDQLFLNRGATERTVKSEFLLETKATNRIKRIIDNSIDEKIFFISINRGETKLFAERVKEPNNLKYLLMENLLNYRHPIFYSQKKKNYEIANTYFDSSLVKYIIEIAITPKDTNTDFAYVNVFITSDRHQIIKVHERFLNSQEPDDNPIGKYGIYRYSDEETLLIFKINREERLELSYLHSFYGNSFYDPGNNKTTFTKDIFVKLNVLGIVKNGEALKNKLPEMQYDKNIYDQDYHGNKSFKLETSIEYTK
ncbi:carboxypeptidase-like regulatory domain-containing protein [candidate division KSB1 bacterium]